MSDLEDINVPKPTHRTKRGFYYYDIVSKEKHKQTLVDVKGFISKYYQVLSYEEIARTVKARFNVILNVNDIKNIALSLNMLPKNISASTRKFVKKSMNLRASRGLFLEYFDFNTLNAIKLKPYG